MLPRILQIAWAVIGMSTTPHTPDQATVNAASIVSEPIRVMWFVSSPMPDACRLFGIPEMPYAGWLTGSVRALEKTDVKLTIVNPSARGPYVRREAAGVTYIQIPAHSITSAITSLLEEMRPHVLHIHGT